MHFQVVSTNKDASLTFKTSIYHMAKSEILFLKGNSSIF